MLFCEKFSEELEICSVKAFPKNCCYDEEGSIVDKMHLEAEIIFWSN